MSSKNQTKNRSKLAGEYEVEKILEMRYDAATKQKFYYVKWKGYNEWTWEPQENLDDCPAILQDFLERRRLAMMPKSDRPYPLSRARVNGLNPNVLHESFMRQLAGRHPSVTFGNDHTADVKGGGATVTVTALARTDLAGRREANRKELQSWELQLNQIAMEHDQAAIFVENGVDMEPPPRNFSYINCYMSGEAGVSIPDVCAGCDCTGACADACACIAQAGDGVRFAYDAAGLLKLKQGEPIYECNRLCACGPSCGNRVVQKGRSVVLTIFRTLNGRGWGVKTPEPIGKGTFIAEYIGEVVTTEAAEKRIQHYNSDERTYLFDLDFALEEDQECAYTIDAGRKGNISHFINHSCEPNLTVFAVWVEHLESLMPRIALFTNRDIAAKEELTFDYKMKRQAEQPEDIEEQAAMLGIPKSVIRCRRIPCRCNAKKCRGFLY